jgi:hypothetical protein
LQTVAEDEYEKALITAVIPPSEVGVKFDHIGALENVKTTLQELVTLPLQRPELFSRGNLTRVRSGHLGYIYCISLFDRKEGIIRNQFRVLLCSYFIFSISMEINSLDVVGFLILGAHSGRDMGLWLGSHAKEYYCLVHLAQARLSLQKQLPQKLVPTL